MGTVERFEKKDKQIKDTAKSITVVRLSARSP